MNGLIQPFQQPEPHSPAVWFSRTVGRGGGAVVYSGLRSFSRTRTSRLSVSPALGGTGRIVLALAGRMDQPAVVSEIGETIESLAAQLEASQPTATILRPNVEMPSGVSTDESLIYRQLTKIVTEIEAMTIEARTRTS